MSPDAHDPEYGLRSLRYSGASGYHLRSNVESAISAVKRKFGDSVRSKCDIAMKNEVLAKLGCHNIVCVIHEMHESGVDPTFWA